MKAKPSEAQTKPILPANLWGVDPAVRVYALFCSLSLSSGTLQSPLGRFLIGGGKPPQANLDSMCGY
jgi:hypothetical protein